MDPPSYKIHGDKKSRKTIFSGFLLCIHQGYKGSLPLGGKKKKKLFVVLLEKVNPNSLPLEKFLQKMVMWRLFHQSVKPQETMYKEC